MKLQLILDEDDVAEAIRAYVKDRPGFGGAASVEIAADGGAFVTAKPNPEKKGAFTYARIAVPNRAEYDPNRPKFGSMGSFTERYPLALGTWMGAEPLSEVLTDERAEAICAKAFPDWETMSKDGTRINKEICRTWWERIASVLFVEGPY
jgi:hypothetical protein